MINIENFIVFNIREHLQDGEIGETELNQQQRTSGTSAAGVGRVQGRICREKSPVG